MTPSQIHLHTSQVQRLRGEFMRNWNANVVPELRSIGMTKFDIAKLCHETWSEFRKQSLQVKS